MNRLNRTWFPLVVFLFLVIVLGWILPKNRHQQDLILKDTTLPEFNLPSLLDTNQHYSNQDIAGQWVVINVWASWCSPCRLEHPVLVHIAKEDHVSILGVNFRDNHDDAMAWLDAHGNPFTWTLVDADGKLAFDWGIVGVPTTWLLTPDGEVVHQHAGILTQQIWDEEFMPIVKRKDDVN